MKLETWEARVVLEKLTIFARTGGGEKEMQIVAAGKSYSVQNLKTTDAVLNWTIPELEMKVEIVAEEDRLHVRFETRRELKFNWPLSGRDPAMTAIIYPDGEGLYVPLEDPFWLGRFEQGYCRDTHGGLSLPFWSYHTGERTVSYLAVSDLQTELCFSNDGDRLSTYSVHAFRERDGLPNYEILIWLGGGSPISPAREYQRWLIERGRYVTMDEKIGANPEASKLLGAAHGYLYGDGRTLEFLEELRGLGIDRFWLG